MNGPTFTSKKPDQTKMLPLLAFLSFDLTSKSIKAKIIRISQILIDRDGQQHFSEHYFNNNRVEISSEAYAYHGISAEMLRDKPKLSSKTFNFNCAKNIVVWDGKVSKTLLRNNDIIGYSSVINLHSLARYLEVDSRPIRLNDYALKNIPHKKFQLEISLRKPENKVKVLVDVFDHLRQAYLKQYGVDKTSFLVVVGKSPTKKEALVNIDAYLKIKDHHEKTKSDYLKNTNAIKTNEVVETGNKRKIIVVNMNKKNDEKTKQKPYSPKVKIKR